MGSGIVCLVLLLLYAALLLETIRKGSKGRKRRISGWYDPMIPLLECRGIFDRIQPVLHRSRMGLAVLEGGTCPPERLLRWAAEGVGMAYTGLFVCWLLAFVSGNVTVGCVGSAVAGCIPFLRVKDLNRQLETRKQAIIMELPVLLSRLLVMVNAGENVLRALQRSADAHPGKGRSQLYAELGSALAAIQRGESLSFAMEEFGRRCAVPEAKLFATLLLMNAKRGGDEFVPALRDLTRQMWERRKTAARTLGEQASSRLAFPLALVFLLIVVLVAAPTLLMM